MDRVTMLKEILEQAPGDAFARYGLALEYANTGQTDEAMQEFQELLARNPEYVPAYQMGAQTLMKAGRTDEARTMVERGIACAIRNGNQHARSEMEMMLEELG